MCDSRYVARNSWLCDEKWIPRTKPFLPVVEFKDKEPDDDDVSWEI